MPEKIWAARRDISQYMPIPIVLVNLALALTVGILLLIRTPAVSAEPPHRINPMRFAEISTTSESASIPAASSTDSINVPILVFHVVRPAYESDSPAVRAIAQTPEVFDAELEYIQNAGYHVISFSELEAYFRDAAPLPPKPMIISFDDGWRNQFVYAFPILQKHGMIATFFVFTNAIGKRGFLSWDNLQTLRDAGMTIGSHSLSHPYLTKIRNIGELTNEIVGSKLLLEAKLGVAINEFAYPFGQYNDAIVAIVRKAGYKSARGDLYSVGQSKDRIYTLAAINTPTTVAALAKKFP
ncbi:polysaccharide deacetylase family protein [Patescibacteria group bacterium]|nr:polysaccharide deacetylase family protein [Patescibacteria group bacterium]